MSVQALSSSFLGVIGRTEGVHLNALLDRGFHVVQCRTANLARLFSYVRDWSGRESWNFGLYGAASETDPAMAEIKALAEAAERYSAAVVADDEFIVASANALGDRCFRWQDLPRLSEAELKAPGQMLHNFDPDAPIRWVRALELQSREPILIPMVTTHLYPRAWTSERFWNPISTGVAVHPDKLRAAVGGILEVIERDALALNWLTQRPLRRIRFSERDLEALAPATAQLLQVGDTALYEGTTDLGLPVVYARRYRPRHPSVVNVVACAADFTVLRAVEKAVSEMVMIGAALEMTVHQPPAEIAEFQSLLDGAVYMMAAPRAAAFGFLDQGGDVGFAQLAERDSEAPQDSNASFLALTASLRQANKRAYLSELTTDELKDCELYSVRAVIPGLMPMSFIHRSRYLASTRLREFQSWLGEPAGNTPLNPFPQPFA